MRITSKEYLKVENFKAFKYIEIYRNGKKIYTIKTENTTETLAELKRKYRHDLKVITAHAGERLKRLAVADGEGGFYSLTHCHYNANMAAELETMRRLKEQLEKENPYAVVMSTARGETEFKRNFKIVYVNWVA